MNVTKDIGQYLSATRTDIDPAEKAALLQTHFLQPMEHVAKIMTENEMILTIDKT